MKKDNITIYAAEKRNISPNNIVSLFINCIISIFSLCIMVDIYCFFHTLIQDDSLEKFLLVILSGLALTFAAALRFSFFSFLKSLAEKYKLLLILGIKSKDFWKLAIKEYFSKVFLLGIKVIIISNVVSILITCIIFFNNAINLRLIIKQFLVTTVLVFLLYAVILTITMITILYNRRKKGLIEFFEHFSQDISKERKHRYGYAWFPILGIAFLLFSFVLLINFRVEKMLLAVFLNIFGAFLLIHSDGVLIKKIIKKSKHIYYKKILIWTDLIYQYKINSYLILVLYTLNFFLVYFMGGLIVSALPQQVSIEEYPYETIIFSDSNIDPQNSYRALLLDVMGYGTVTAISNYDYNQLTKTEYHLEKGEVLFLDEREKEADSPLTEKELNILSRGGNGEHLSYSVKDAEWKVIFGRNAFREMDGVIVFNDKDFDLLSEGNAGSEKFIFLSNQPVNGDHGSVKLKAGVNYWNRTEQVTKEQIENKVLLTLIYLISLILILEGQAFIFTKQIVNLKEEGYRYDVLKRLGIKKVELEKIIEKKIKGILMIPAVLALISGLIFFATDFCQEPSGFTLLLLLYYVIAIMSFALIQILGCCFISRKIKKLYLDG